MAQSNIRQRLAIRYGERASMTVKQTQDLYQVTLYLPNEVTE
jgi:LytS/YehU family sensor histidine kinase